jgi:hypothetical protein
MIRMTLAAFVTAASLVLAAFAPIPVQASEDLLWGPVSVTTSALASSTLYGAKYDSIRVLANNTSGNATRSVVITCTDSSGNTMHALPGVSVANGANGQIVMDPQVTTTTNIPAGVTLYSMHPCPWFKVTAAAASGTLKVTVSGRK